MPLKTILLFPLLLLAVSCYEVEHNCKKFKTGKFRFEYQIEGVKKTTYFERNDSIEIENYNGKIDTASIRWVNDCEYVLRKLHPKNITEQKAINMKILSTSGETYTFEFGILGDSQKQRGTVTKLE